MSAKSSQLQPMKHNPLMFTTSVCSNLIYHKPFLTRMRIKAKHCLHVCKEVSKLLPPSFPPGPLVPTSHSRSNSQRAGLWLWPEDFPGLSVPPPFLSIEFVCLRSENVCEFSTRLPGYVQMQKRSDNLDGTCQVNKDGLRMFEGLGGAGRQVTQGTDRQCFSSWKICSSKKRFPSSG